MLSDQCGTLPQVCIISNAHIMLNVSQFYQVTIHCSVSELWPKLWKQVNYMMPSSRKTKASEEEQLIAKRGNRYDFEQLFPTAQGKETA